MNMTGFIIALTVAMMISEVGTGAQNLDSYKRIVKELSSETEF